MATATSSPPGATRPGRWSKISGCVEAGLVEIARLGCIGFPRAPVARGAPNPRVAAAHYRKRAAGYDLWTDAGQVYRRDTVQRLQLSQGEVVLDVGCGTGLNFAALEAQVGPGGRVIGLDLSTEMLAQAQARIQRHDWANVTLIGGAIEKAAIPVEADAALLCGVHDVLRSPVALANVVDHVRPGGQIVAGGAKWVSWRRPNSFAFNFYIWLMNRDYVTTFEGFAKPWSHLARLVSGIEVDEVFLGGGFIATGTVPRSPPRASTRRRGRHRSPSSSQS